MTGEWLDPSKYAVYPRQWKLLDHPYFGKVVAAMMPYPDATIGLCRGDSAWTDENEMKSSTKRDYMKGMCNRCPVKPACQEYGIAHEPVGIWGGTEPSERKAIRRERKQIMVEPHSAHEYGFTDDYFAFLNTADNLQDYWEERRAEGATEGTRSSS